MMSPVRHKCVAILQQIEWYLPTPTGCGETAIVSAKSISCNDLGVTAPIRSAGFEAANPNLDDASALPTALGYLAP